MASRSTRNKVRWQCRSALEDLASAQTHLVRLAAIADEHSDHINDHIPELIACLEMFIKAVEKFNESL